MVRGTNNAALRGLAMNLSNIDLNLLVALDVLLQERSVSRAAERLRIGQPAMSATLGRLRALFNDQLLVRAGRSLEATPFAESLAEPVSDILHRIDSLVNVVHRFDPAVDHRTFSVIASDYITLVLLKPLLTRLASTAPNVRIQTHLLEPDFLTQLGRGSVDALVVPQQGLSDLHAFHVEPLFSDRFVIVTDRDNTSIGEEITAEEFSELPYLRCNSGVMSSFADLHLDRLGIKRNVEMLATSFVMARFMLPGTPMITVVQEKLARILLPESQFRIVHSPIPLPAIDEVLVPAPKRYADAGQIWLHDQIRAVAATL